MNTIKNTSITRLRNAARAQGLSIVVQDMDPMSDVVRLVAVSTWNNRPNSVKNREADTREAFASFFESCDAAQKLWVNGEFRFEKTAGHLDRRYVSGEFLNVRG